MDSKAQKHESPRKCELLPLQRLTTPTVVATPTPYLLLPLEINDIIPIIGYHHYVVILHTLLHIDTIDYGGYLSLLCGLGSILDSSRTLYLYCPQKIQN